MCSGPFCWALSVSTLLSYRMDEAHRSAVLRRFKGTYIIDAQGKRVMLLTDLDELDELGSAGELSFESLYLRSR